MHLIAFSALCVAFGSFLISKGLSGADLERMISFSFSGFQFSRLILVAFGFSLNLIGSLTWAAGRSHFTHYSVAWTTYLALLIIFGASVGIVFSGDKMSINLMIGILLVIIGAFFLNA